VPALSPGKSIVVVMPQPSTRCVLVMQYTVARADAVSRAPRCAKKE
jgi:hypothetical protein